MKILVVMPKISCYENKSADVQRTYKAAFKEWIKFLQEQNCTFEYMLEDTLARDIFNELGIKASVFTCISPSDIQFFRQKSHLVDIPDYVYNEHNMVPARVGDVEKKYSVPLAVLKESKDLFLDKRVDVCKKRIRTATEEVIKSSKNVLMFSANTLTNRCSALSEQVYQGDGRLLLEYFLERGFINCYYGGVYIPQDYLPAIIQTAV